MNENVTNQSSGTQVDASIPAWLIPSLILVALGGAFLGDQCMIAFNEFFYPEPHGQQAAPPEWVIAERWAVTWNTGIGFGLMGAGLFAVIGGLLGATNSVPRAIVGAVIGAVAGLIVAVPAGVGYFIQSKMLTVIIDGMFKSIIFNAAIYATVGLLGAALAIGLCGVAKPGKALVGGLLISLLMLVVHQIVAIAVFPISRPEYVYAPDLGMRYSGLISLCLSGPFAAIFALREKPDESSTTEEASEAAIEE